MSLKESIIEMRNEVQLFLFECCQEMLEYSDTGILCSGTVRRITSMLLNDPESSIGYHDASSIVHTEIREQAMRFLIKNW